MNKPEFDQNVGNTAEVFKSKLGDGFNGLGVVSGTGWDKGIARVFKERERVRYADLNIPGASVHVMGHDKDIKIGEIDGRNALVLGRIHPNENVTDPDVRQAMAIIITALDKCLEGLVVTNAVGTLHGPVGADAGFVKSMVRTAILDALGWAHRGRRQEKIGVGDVAIVDDIKTGMVGSFTPFLAGDFVDFYHDGLHGHDDMYFDFVRKVVTKVQGRCPRAQARYITGPQFEGPADKIEFRGHGDDIIGMSGIQEILTCAKLKIPVSQIVFATNGPFVRHSHAVNLVAANGGISKVADILSELARGWPKREMLRNL